MHHSHDIKVKVEREKLLHKLRENREKHKTEYDDVVQGWMDAVKKEAQKIVELAEAGKLESIKGIQNHHAKPENHVPDYDSVIEMLEMTGDLEIELDQDDFNTFVRDEWSWKRDWSSSNTSYSSSSTSSSR